MGVGVGVSSDPAPPLTATLPSVGHKELGIIKGKENFEGNTSLYQHILNNIRENDYDKSVLSQEFVIELHGLVTLLRSRHEAVPPDKISTQQFYHILTFLVCRMDAEKVTKKLVKALKRRIPNEGGTHIWQPGIDIIMKENGDKVEVEDEDEATADKAKNKG